MEPFAMINTINKEINIVYYIWINPKRDWKIILSGQLSDIKKSNILEKSNLYIVICGENHDVLNAKYIILKLLENDIGSLHFIATQINNYEYPGFKTLYDLAILQPDEYYIYLHGKGMGNFNNPKKRNILEKLHTKNIIYNWKYILSIFENDKNILKVGLFPSIWGAVWYNYFWVRGSYLISCEMPIVSSDRYYYEGWLGTGNVNMNDSYSLFSNDTKKYSHEELMLLTSNMLKKYDYLNAIKGKCIYPLRLIRNYLSRYLKGKSVPENNG